MSKLPEFNESFLLAVADSTHPKDMVMAQGVDETTAEKIVKQAYDAQAANLG